MGKKKRDTPILPVITEISCKGFQVIAWFADGSIDAFSNCNLDEMGQCSSYTSPFTGQVISADKVKSGHQVRLDAWLDKYDAVGVWLASR